MAVESRLRIWKVWMLNRPVKTIKKEEVMKRISVLLVLFGILVSCAKNAPKVLLFIRDGSPQLEYMLIHEVGTMRKILEQSGFKVTIATLSGEVLKTDSITVTPHIKLGDVNIADYAGFILPCMASDSTHSETVSFVKEAVKLGKPIAAQLGSVVTLAGAGVLHGKKFAFPDDKDMNAKLYPELNDGIYSGKGVVQDGLIITSGICPWMAKMPGHQDGTVELTRALIDTMRALMK
jgi:putative intracellular protease/amidase